PFIVQLSKRPGKKRFVVHSLDSPRAPRGHFGSILLDLFLEGFQAVCRGDKCGGGHAPPVHGVTQPAFGLKLRRHVRAIRHRAHHRPRYGLSSAAECRTPFSAAPLGGTAENIEKPDRVGSPPVAGGPQLANRATTSVAPTAALVGGRHPTLAATACR